MTTDLVIHIPGRKPLRLPIFAGDEERLAAALAKELPGIARAAGRVSAVIEKAGVTHIITGLRR